MIILRSVAHSVGVALAKDLDFTQGALEVYDHFANPGQDGRDVITALCKQGAVYAYTREGSDKVLALHGYTSMWKGVAEIWLAQTTAGEAVNAKDRRAMLVRGIKLHSEMMEAWNLHRLQTTSPHDSAYHERMKRVAKIAGFHYEGTKIRYTAKGVDCDIWSLTREVRK